MSVIDHPMRRDFRLNGPAWAWPALLGFALTLLGAWTSLRLQMTGIAVFWPAAGVICGLMLIVTGAARRWMIGGVLLALALGNVSTGRSIDTALVFMAGNVFEAMLLARMLKAWDEVPPRMDSLLSVGRFLSLAGVAALVSGALVAVGLRMTGHIANLGVGWWY